MAQQVSLPVLYRQQYDEIIIIAHRGASARYPENTFSAFEAALALGADMIELDVMLSSDGVPVVFHDARLDTHTNGRGRLDRLTLSELKALDAGSWFSPEFADQTIPTLEEVLDFARDRIALNIEIKTEAVSSQRSGGVEERCLQLVEQYGMQQHVLFSSFDYRAVSHLKALDASTPVALLYDRAQSGDKRPSEVVRAYHADAFNCSYRQFSKSWSADLRQHDIPHFIYTVDHPRKMRKLLKAGVSGIFTNKPDILASVTAQFKEGRAAD